MPKIDEELQNQVRRALVRMWVDPNRLHVAAGEGMVTVRGTLTKRTKPRGEAADDPKAVEAFASIDEMFLQRLETAVKAVPGVKLVRWQLDDWVKTGGDWGKREG